MIDDYGKLEKLGEGIQVDGKIKDFKVDQLHDTGFYFILERDNLLRTKGEIVIVEDDAKPNIDVKLMVLVDRTVSDITPNKLKKGKYNVQIGLIQDTNMAL